MSPLVRLDGTAGKAPESPAQAEERWRLQTLRSFDVLDTPCEEVFDRLARLARVAIGTRMAAVSLVDADREWFKARIGFDAAEVPRAVSFGTRVLERDTVMVVEDAAQDPAFAGCPLVAAAPLVRFYAGAPLVAVNGQRVGTLCLMDNRPRTFSGNESAFLVELAAMVVRELELRRITPHDPLTGAYARGHFLDLAEKEQARARRYGTPLSLFMMDIDHLRTINDTHGLAGGDRVLRQAVDACQGTLRAHDLVGRLGGEEFAVLLPQTDGADAVTVAERVRGVLESMKLNIAGETVTFTASFGVAASAGPEDTVTAMVDRAGDALFRAKHGGRNCVVTVERESPEEPEE